VGVFRGQLARGLSAGVSENGAGVNPAGFDGPKG
jgi:hypothetical protein